MLTLLKSIASKLPHWLLLVAGLSVAIGPAVAGWLTADGFSRAAAEWTRAIGLLVLVLAWAKQPPATNDASKSTQRGLVRIPAMVLVLCVGLLVLSAVTAGGGARHRATASRMARSELVSLGGCSGTAKPPVGPVVTDIGQIILSCGGTILTAVENGATTFEQITEALAGSTCGPVTVAEVEQIVQLFTGANSLDGGTLPYDVVARAAVPATRAKLLGLKHGGA